MTQTEQINDVVEVIDIKAPAARVFAALTEAKELLQWWSGGSCPLADIEADVRPGGAWKYSGTDSDGDAFFMKGAYTIVEAPHLLEFTWMTDSLTQAGVPPTTVRYELTETNGSTTLTLRHSGFVRENDRANHAAGWKVVLGMLSSHFTK